MYLEENIQQEYVKNQSGEFEVRIRFKQTYKMHENIPEFFTSSYETYMYTIKY